MLMALPRTFWVSVQEAYDASEGAAVEEQAP
jgi:hypothetical protein